MKAALLSGSLSRNSGGLFTSVRRLAENLRSADWEVQVFGWYDEYFDQDGPAWQEPRPIALHPRSWAPSGYTPELPGLLTQFRPDVVHPQFLWTYASRCNLEHSRRHGTPYVISPRGMLDPWALRRSGWKKALARRLFEGAHLSRAGCLHALCEEELHSVRRLGLRNPVCVIPNGVDLPELANGAEQNGSPSAARRKTLLYLGRIHPKKGLAHLLRAWRGLRQRGFAPLREWTAVIAGWDQAGHATELATLAAELGIADDVRFAGPLFGDAKDAAFRSADAVVLPSLSEGLPMVALEAWSYGKPVLMTPQCNLPEGVAVEAAIAVQPDAESLADGLATLLTASDEQRTAMGRRGLELVRQRFTWSKAAGEMAAVYRWLVGGGATPSCIVRE